MSDLWVAIDKVGRVVLPKSVRQQLSIQPGEKMKVSVHGDSITLTTSTAQTGLIRKGKALVFASAGSTQLTIDSVNNVMSQTRVENPR